jgi:fatty acid desaturase
VTINHRLDVSLRREAADDQRQGAWYLRQVLGSANFEGGGLTHLMTGNLDHQIEHHLFPDLPSERYPEIAPKVRANCESHGIAYNTGSFPAQLASFARKLWRLRKP